MQIELLILLRLATVESLDPGSLVKQLRTLLPLDDAKQAFEDGMRGLAAAGLITLQPLRITESGRARAAAALGVRTVPAWREVRNRYLPALVPRRWTDDDVVAAVRMATARVPESGRHGRDRVFISAIWRQLEHGVAFPGLTLDGLKKRLVAASRRQQLSLARADPLGALDRREVAESEIRHLRGTFHFVVDR